MYEDLFFLIPKHCHALPTKSTGADWGILSILEGQAKWKENLGQKPTVGLWLAQEWQRLSPAHILVNLSKPTEPTEPTEVNVNSISSCLSACMGTGTSLSHTRTVLFLERASKTGQDSKWCEDLMAKKRASNSRASILALAALADNDWRHCRNLQSIAKCFVFQCVSIHGLLQVRSSEVQARCSCIFTWHFWTKCENFWMAKQRHENHEIPRGDRFC